MQKARIPANPAGDHKTEFELHKKKLEDVYRKH